MSRGEFFLSALIGTSHNKLLLTPRFCVPFEAFISIFIFPNDHCLLEYFASCFL